MKITLPELCLVILVGTSGSGKSTFARKHFKATEIISSDFCRGLVADDENDQAASPAAFELVHFIARKRLSAGRVSVIDATNVKPEDRQYLIELAREENCLSAAIVLNVEERVCHERNAQRPDRDFGPHVIRNQRKALSRSLRGLRREGFHRVFILDSQEEIDNSTIEYVPLWNNLKHEQGPFDIIGDVHGCFDELLQLMQQLGYTVRENEQYQHRFEVTPPAGRKAIFVGDLVDRGPRSPDVLRLVMGMVESGTGLCVAGNHDVKLMRKLQGKNVSMTHGLPESMAQLESEPDEFKQEIVRFIEKLIGHYVLDGGKLVVAHAGLKEAYHGRSSARVRDFALFGETTGETDEYGLPVRYNWAADYRGRAMVVYGHTPVPESEWLNHTICLDTGCVFGGKLTALRYPEKELVQVPAARMYYHPIKPLVSEKTDHHGRQDEELNIKDVTGKRILHTQLQHSITIREENACAALEVMSRFAINPRWLVYLPPTMSPCGTSQRPGYLEHPEEALKYYLDNGIEHVVCEEKHMGSRAIVVLCRSEEAATRRFGVKDEGIGVCYTRTGRRFFNDVNLEKQFLHSLSDAVSESDFWSEFNTDWLVLDCELMPWSVKAQDLLRRQYAATGAAARTAMRELEGLVTAAAERGLDVEVLTASYTPRKTMVTQYIEAYRKYCWPVNSLKDIKLAPFHLLATEGATHFDKNHLWHMGALAKLSRVSEDELVIATQYRTVELADQQQVEGAINWWEELTAGGGEGMVVKPANFIARGTKGVVQPAVKCRGKEYLRIIYGPEYSDERYLDRLRRRGLGMKRSLAMREFALGVESLQRFVNHEPLYRVHECVFGVLAMESEPVDPRL